MDNMVTLPRAVVEAVIADRDGLGFMFHPRTAETLERWRTFVAAVTAARSAPAIPADETAWLLERTDLVQPKWYGRTLANMGRGDVWTSDASLAIRFCREQDAMEIALLLARTVLGANVLPREHAWPSLQPPADTVTIERRTRADWNEFQQQSGSVKLMIGECDLLRRLGLIKPDPDPYQEHLSKHGLTDTVEARAMFDSFQEVR